MPSDDKGTPEGTTTPGAADVLTTEVAGSAEAYRKLGEVFVATLAAIPTATLATTLIRAPGDAGLHEFRLAAGIVLASVGLTLGVWLAIWLRTPVELSREELDGFRMDRIVGTNQPTYGRLLTRIDQLGDAVAEADELTRPAYERRLRAVLATLRSVHLLATAEVLRSRVTSNRTKELGCSALAAAAAATFFLATAPKPKPAEDAATATGPSVVTVTLTPAGARTLGCPKETFTALKLGGTETEPQVIPQGLSCTKGDYLTVGVGQMASATEVKPLEPKPKPSAKALSVTGAGAPTSAGAPATSPP